MHVIVGQGQLDTILHATPEDRRGFIEEAAGVLKHRKRKEKALRKLDSTEGNLHPARRPAQRDPPPAQAAGPAGRGGPPGGRRAGRRPRRPGPADGRRPRRPRGPRWSRSWPTRRCWSSAASQVEAAIAEAQQQEARPRGGAARGPARAVPRPGDLVRAVRAARAAARHPVAGRRAGPQRRRRASEAESEPAATPTSSRPRPPRSASRSSVIDAEVAARRTALEEAVAARRAAEDAAAEEERRVAGLQRAAADRREGLARLHGQVNALKSRAAAADDEVGRLAQSPRGGRGPGRARPARLHRRSRPGSPGSTPARRASTPSTRRPAPSSTTSTSGWPRPARRRSRPSATGPRCWPARTPSRSGLNRKDGAGALLAATDDVSGLLGSVAALLSVRTGFETAVAAALGSAADAVAVADADAAVGAIGHLKADDLGRAGLLLGGGPDGRPRLARPARPARRTPSTWSTCPADLRGRADPAAAQGASWSTTSPPRGRWSPSCPTSPR